LALFSMINTIKLDLPIPIKNPNSYLNTILTQHLTM